MDDFQQEPKFDPIFLTTRIKLLIIMKLLVCLLLVILSTFVIISALLFYYFICVDWYYFSTNYYYTLLTFAQLSIWFIVVVYIVLPSVSKRISKYCKIIKCKEFWIKNSNVFITRDQL